MDSSVCVHHGSHRVPIPNRLIARVKTAVYVFNYHMVLWVVVVDMVSLVNIVIEEIYVHLILVEMEVLVLQMELLLNVLVDLAFKEIYVKFATHVNLIHV